MALMISFYDFFLLNVVDPVLRVECTCGHSCLDIVQVIIAVGTPLIVCILLQPSKRWIRHIVG